MRIFVPYVLGEVDKEWIGIFSGFWCPITAFPFWVDNMTFKNLFMGINEPTVLYSTKLFFVDFVYLRTYMPIIQVNTVNLILFYQLKQLVQQ